MSSGSWSANETELLRVGALKYGSDFEALAGLFADKSPSECQRKLEEITARKQQQQSPVAAAPAASTVSGVSSGGAPPGSIIPAAGISGMAKLLFVTAKLHSRNLLSQEEKRILKQLAIRSDPALNSIDMNSEQFLTQLIDLASARAITAASHTYNFLYQQCSTNHGKTLSKQERKSKGITDNSFVYGEIDFHSFAQIIKHLRPLIKPDGVFVDLGSGTGRPCIAMALLSDMQRIVGIEYLSDLVTASRQVLEQYETFVESDAVEVEDDDNADDDDEQQQEQPPAGKDSTKQTPSTPGTAGKKKKIVHSPLTKLERAAEAQRKGQGQRSNSIDAGAPGNLPLAKRIEFLQGDFLEIDWSHADFVFLNSTCYSPALMTAISAKAELLRPGALVVSLTKPLLPSSTDKFELLSKQKYQMSWGSATAYVQKRR